MIKRTPLTFCLLSLGLVMFTTGCQSPVEAPVWSSYPELINGRWEMVTAFRNERQTQTLDGTFFNFSKQQSLITNLPIPVNVGPDGGHFVSKYTFVQDTILLSGQLPLQFIIEKLDSHSMMMSTTINQQHFRFDLSRH